MKHLLKQYVNQITNKIAGRVIEQSTENASLADSIAYRISLESIVTPVSMVKPLDETFYGISDDFWFWLNTEGVRRNAMLRRLLPGVPDEYTQEMFTGAKGDAALREGFTYYKIFKEEYEKYRGPLAQAAGVLDYGCGWGRLVRFFLKDIESSKVWGCDPVADMIALCRNQNPYCQFQEIPVTPPTPFADNTFDLVYSFSVFSHLSEDMHLKILHEIKRILKPGGLYMTTTRSRSFIEACAQLRQLTDLEKMNPGPRTSAAAFPDTAQSLAVYDQGAYCHHSFNDEGWPHWGETAISKAYVMKHWAKHFKVLDFIEMPNQHIIIVQKDTDA